MDAPWLRTTFQYFRQINFSRRIKAHNNNLELLSPNKKWFYADAIIIQDFQVCGYWIDDHYRIWRLIVTNHFKSHLFANKGDTFYNNKLEYIIHSYDHTHTHWRHGLEKYESFFQVYIKMCSWGHKKYTLLLTFGLKTSLSLWKGDPKTLK